MTELSRRNLLRAAAVAGGAAGAGAVIAGPARADARGRGKGDRLALVNGRIHTMDGRDRVVSEVLVEDGRFVEVGRNVDTRDARKVDLRGRTVVPGLIEGHVHVVSLATRPGYHTVIENAANIAEIQQMLADRRAGKGFGFVAGTPYRRGSSSRRWAAGTSTCSPNTGCRRSPSSTRRYPTGRSWCSRAAAARRPPTASARRSSRRLRIRSPARWSSARTARSPPACSPAPRSTTCACCRRSRTRSAARWTR